MHPAIASSTPDSSGTPRPPRGRPTGDEWQVPPALEKTHLTIRQAARELSCSQRTVGKLIQTKRLVSIKYLNIHRLITRKSLQFLIAAESGPGLPASSDETITTKGRPHARP